MLKMDIKRIGNELMKNSSTVGSKLDRDEAEETRSIIRGG